MKIVCSSTLLSRCPAMSIAPITSVSRPRAETGTKVVIFSVDSRKNAIACAFCADPAAAKRSFARPRDVGPARPEGSFRRDRVRPARDCWKRKSFKATCALDKISASARTENRGRGGQLKCASISRPRDVGPARPERSFLKLNRAPTPKEAIQLFRR